MSKGLDKCLRLRQNEREGGPLKHSILPCFLFCILAGPALGQVLPPPQGGGTTTISCDQRVKGLHYDATATPGCQAVEFTFTAAAPQGVTISGTKWVVGTTIVQTG